MLAALSAAALPPLPSSPVILMVSGGSDSTALLVRAVRGTLDLADGRGAQRIDAARLAVLHVNHMIRGAASDGDEAFVRGLCAELGVALRVVRVDVPALVRAARASGDRNLEEIARTARYEAAWGLACELSAAAGVPVETARICVAHTADDRAETFVMRAMTGAGLPGLTGMRTSCGIVARPLIGATRMELRALLDAWDIGWREDATNDEDVALRSYVRHHVLPPMRERNPALSATMGRMLDVLAQEDDLLARLADGVLSEALRVEGALGQSGGSRSDEPEPAEAAPAESDVPGQLGAPRGHTASAGALPLSVGNTLQLDAAVLVSADPALARRALLRGLGLLLGEADLRRARLEGRHVETLLALARAGRGSATLPLAIDARCEDGVLRVGRPGSAAASGLAVADAPAPEALSVPGCLVWEGVRLEAALVEVPSGADVVAFAREQAAEATRGMGAPDELLPRPVALLDAERAGVAGGGALLVRAPRPGERVRPLGLHGHTKLVADLLMEAHVPAALRFAWPLVCACPTRAGASAGARQTATYNSVSKAPQTGGVSCGADDSCVVWVAGIRPDESAAYHKGTRVLLRLTAIPAS
ncbi:MAG: tRNA lysidine(34) synthetase TilS [Coriobacteriia bacterium]|nr:tRNA lysidine(34) synthetase TilS [Coriobacteriia bacterium]MBS5478609.1 tRNA lysidine(34) synthetase TilS [Coriobacteriia bacterium]